MLPHATPSTGREAGAAACRAARVVPSPPTASSRSQDDTSTVSAIRRGCPGIAIWPTSTPCWDAQSRIARSGASMLRRGWTTSPSRLILLCTVPPCLPGVGGQQSLAVPQLALTVRLGGLNLDDQSRVGGGSPRRHAVDDGGDQRLHHRQHVLQMERALALLGGRD